MPSSVTIGTWNVNGMLGSERKKQLVSYFLMAKVDVLAFQEHHLPDTFALELSKTLERPTLLLTHCGLSFNPKNITLISSQVLSKGRILLSNIKLAGGQKIWVGPIYAPPKPPAQASFFKVLSSHPNLHQPLLLMGNYNCWLDQYLDWVPQPYPRCGVGPFP